ncbi:MAG: DUF3800 domain-containing protein [Armatimonadota bacterium]
MAGKQLVYLDESGDPGFKMERGSSPVLVVAAAIFGDAAEAERTARAIHAHRESIGKGHHFQFHFTELSRPYREAFLRSVRHCPFRVRAIVMRKDRIWEGTQLRRSPKHFYNFTIKMLLTHTFGAVREAKVFIDGTAGRLLSRNLAAYLRRECNLPDARVVAQLRFARKGNVLIQLADMVVGSLARSYRPDKADSSAYRAILRPRIEDVWEFGEKDSAERSSGPVP